MTSPVCARVCVRACVYDALCEEVWLARPATVFLKSVMFIYF